MIVSAAVRYSYKDEIGLTIEQIMPVHRHKDCDIILKQLDIEDYTIEEEGFLTEKGEFLGRFDALCEAVECGQLSELSDEQFEMIVASDKLMSEDLW